MRNTKKMLAVIATMVVLTGNVVAQEKPYKGSIGGVIGTIEGVSFKAFLSPKIAFHADFGYKFGYFPIFAKGYYGSSRISDIELNPNLLFQKNIQEWKVGRLDWYAGAGLSIGYAFWGSSLYYGYYGYLSSSRTGKFGINLDGGVEFSFKKIPLALSADFRPGYGLIFRPQVHTSYFDWSITVSARYCFGKNK
jgi:hypothetical protein